MKKRLLLLLCVCNFMLGTSVIAKELIPLQVCCLDDERIGHGYPKSPNETPTVYLDDHTLSFSYAFSDIVPIELLDEDGIVVYTDWLAPGQTTLIFPSTLSGEYTIRLTVGSLYYIGVIEL